MLWNTQTQDSNVMQLVGDGGEVLGIVYYNPSVKKFVASTQKKYLGTYPLLKFAQRAVENAYNAAVKGSGRIIVVGGFDHKPTNGEGNGN